MKLAIVIPLKSKTVSNDWSLVESNLKRTIQSINNQTSRSFRLIIVGHEEPSFLDDYKHREDITFIKLSEFPPPQITGSITQSERQKLFDNDKSLKVLKGFVYLNSLVSDITHWFVLDADDLLHSSFVHNLQKLTNAEADDAIILERGYFYYEKYGVFNKSEVFSQFCGSSCILGKKLLNIPSSVLKENLSFILFNQVSHTAMPGYLLKNGIKYKVPKQKLVIYVRDNGENISAGKIELIYKIKRFIKMKLRATYLSKKEKGAFGL
jgi:glycosyltransferase involved in cell wall biosynthesis